jgi:hypothetical protein
MPSSIRRLDDLSFVSRTPQKRQILWLVLTIFLFVEPSAAQQAQPKGTTWPDTPPSEPASPQTPEQNPSPGESPATLPAGTQLALILTHPIDSKTMHRGDAVFAQITDPVSEGNQVVIPAGAFVQGKVEKLTRQGSRAELLLKSVSIALPDGYVFNISGPVEMESGEGTAWRNPSSGAQTMALLAPFLGSGLGTAIGAAAHTTQTSSLGGMTITSSTPKGMAIGGITGLAAGSVVSLILLARSHQFYVPDGSPLEIVLAQPVTLARGPAGDATGTAAGQR